MKLSKKIFLFLTAARVFSAAVDVDGCRGKGKGLRSSLSSPFSSTSKTTFEYQRKTAKTKKNRKAQSVAIKSLLGPQQTQQRARRCAINSLWKTTPFSKLWVWVIWSEEVAKNIAPNRFDKMLMSVKRNREHWIYDLPFVAWKKKSTTCRFICWHRKQERLFAYIKNESGNKFHEARRFFFTGPSET